MGSSEPLHLHALFVDKDKLRSYDQEFDRCRQNRSLRRYGGNPLIGWGKTSGNSEK
jgi:hypothetical protein